VTYNKHNTYPWFRERVYKLEDKRHDPADFRLALERAFEWGAEIPIGLFYKVERPTYEDEDPVLSRSGKALAKQPLERAELAAIMEDFI
jgi:2-oxoglutarate ferredoxin oxidoreductase subunit beta